MKKLTMVSARALLNVSYDQITKTNQEALLTFIPVLRERFNECAVGPASRGNRKHPQDILKLVSDIEIKLAILGHVFPGVNNDMSSICRLGNLGKYDLMAKPTSIFEKEKLAYRKVCKTNPHAVFGNSFQKKHSDKSPNKRLALYLEEHIYDVLDGKDMKLKAKAKKLLGVTANPPGRAARR